MLSGQGSFASCSNLHICRLSSISSRIICEQWEENFMGLWMYIVIAAQIAHCSANAIQWVSNLDDLGSNKDMQPQ